jgi:hypothetical protein
MFNISNMPGATHVQMGSPQKASGALDVKVGQQLSFGAKLTIQDAWVQKHAANLTGSKKAVFDLAMKALKGFEPVEKEKHDPSNNSVTCNLQRPGHEATSIGFQFNVKNPLAGVTEGVVNFINVFNKKGESILALGNKLAHALGKGATTEKKDSDLTPQARGQYMMSGNSLTRARMALNEQTPVGGKYALNGSDLTQPRTRLDAAPPLPPRAAATKPETKSSVDYTGKPAAKRPEQAKGKTSSKEEAASNASEELALVRQPLSSAVTGDAGEGKALAITKESAYKTLGLQQGASEVDIKQAFRKLVLSNHPDKNSNSTVGGPTIDAIKGARDFLLKA